MKCKGYFTVEASILLPFILLILMWVIYIGFFFYDRCLLTQDVYIMAMTESRNYYQSNAQMYQNAKEAEKEWEWKKYVAFQKEDIEVEVGMGRIKMTGKGFVRVPFHFPFLENKRWNICVMRQSGIVNPVMVMRSYKKIQKYGKEVENEKGND